MARNRIVYGLVLLSAGVFFVCFNGYLSLYVLRVAAALPFLSLLLSLPGMLGVRLELKPLATRARKGDDLPLQLRFSHRVPWLVSPRGRATLTLSNTLTGQVQQERLEFTAARAPAVLTYRFTSPACGKVELGFLKARVTDYLGLFAFPLRAAELPEASVLFLPAPATAPLLLDTAAQTAGEGERYSQFRPGDDPAELFDFREYREGDRLSRVHWKLSQRMDELQVRELGLPVSDRVFFLLEPLGTGEQCDALLDVFATLSAFLGEQEMPHRVAFAPGKDQALTLLALEAPEDARPALEALLLAGRRTSPVPIPLERELPPGSAHLMYLCCTPFPATVRALAQAGGERVTVIRTTPRQNTEEALPPLVEEITALPGQLDQDLAGLTL